MISNGRNIKKTLEREPEVSKYQEFKIIIKMLGTREKKYVFNKTMMYLV